MRTRKAHAWLSNNRVIAEAVIIGMTVTIGCANFDDPSTVKDLRVLAVRAEPSEIILDLTDPGDLSAATIPDIEITPLIIDTAGDGRPIVVTVSACANEPGAMPPPNSGGQPGFPSGGPRTTIGSALCDAAPTRVEIAADVDIATNPSIVARLDPSWIMNAFAHDVFAGLDGRIHGGVDLGMPIVFQVSARAGPETVSAIKRVIFWARPVSADQRPNLTPEISGVTVYDQRDEKTAEPTSGAIQSLVNGDAALVSDKGLWVDPAPADAESYVTAVLDRGTGLVVPHSVKAETLTYTFYATVGTFSPFETSSEPAPGVTIPTRVHIESKYRPPPATDGPTDVTIWIVVRDERGGSSFVTRTLRVQARSPSGAGAAGP